MRSLSVTDKISLLISLIPALLALGLLKFMVATPTGHLWGSDGPVVFTKTTFTLLIVVLSIIFYYVSNALTGAFSGLLSFIGPKALRFIINAGLSAITLLLLFRNLQF